MRLRATLVPGAMIERSLTLYLKTQHLILEILKKRNYATFIHKLERPPLS